MTRVDIQEGVWHPCPQRYSPVPKWKLNARVKKENKRWDYGSWIQSIYYIFLGTCSERPANSIITENNEITTDACNYNQQPNYEFPTCPIYGQNELDQKTPYQHIDHGSWAEVHYPVGGLGRQFVEQTRPLEEKDERRTSDYTVSDRELRRLNTLARGGMIEEVL